MAEKTPDPLAPGHIEGQNPATPQRHPGHSGYYGDKRERQPQKPDTEIPKVYQAQDVRQGRIVLRRPWQRGVFIAGLAGAVALPLILYVLSRLL